MTLQDILIPPSDRLIRSDNILEHLINFQAFSLANQNSSIRFRGDSMHLPILLAFLSTSIIRDCRLPVPQTTFLHGLASGDGDGVSEAIKTYAFHVDRAREQEFRLRGIDG